MRDKTSQSAREAAQLPMRTCSSPDRSLLTGVSLANKSLRVSLVRLSARGGNWQRTRAADGCVRVMHTLHAFVRHLLKVTGHRAYLDARSCIARNCSCTWATGASSALVLIAVSESFDHRACMHATADISGSIIHIDTRSWATMIIDDETKYWSRRRPVGLASDDRRS